MFQYCRFSYSLLPLNTGAMQLNISAFNMEDVFSVSVNTIKGNADAKKISIGDDTSPAISSCRVKPLSHIPNIN